MFLEMTSIRKHNLIFFQFYSQKGDGAPPTAASYVELDTGKFYIL